MFSQKSSVQDRELKPSRVSFLIIFSFLIILGSFLVAGAAEAANNPAGTYYICPTATGDGSGSSFGNCRSVANHNTDTWNAPSTIYLCGSITSSIAPPSSGISTNSRIIYDGTCNGNTGSISVGSGVFGVNIATKSWLTFQNISIISPDAYGLYALNGTGINLAGVTVSGATGVFFNGTATVSVSGNSNLITTGATGTYGFRASSVDVTLNDVAITAAGGNGIYLSAATTVSMDNVTIGATTRYGIWAVAADNLTWTANTVSVAGSGTGYPGIYINANSKTNLTLAWTGIVSSNSLDSGLKIDGAGIWAASTIEDSTFDSNALTGVTLTNVEEFTLDNITLTDNASIGVNFVSSSGNIVQNSTITENGNGVYLNNSNNNNIIDNSLTNWNGLEYGSGGDGYDLKILGSSAGNLVSRNSFTEGYVSIVLGSTSGGGANVIKNNLIIRPHVNGIYVGTGGATVAPDQVMNNTIIHSPTASGGSVGHGLVFTAVGVHGFECNKGFVKNNIFVGETAGAEIISIDSGIGIYPTGMSAITLDNNLYYQSNAGAGWRLFDNSGNDTTAYTNWVASLVDAGITGAESKSIKSDPLLSSYIPAFSSPAIDSGADVSLTADYAGNPIYGPPDIGAYEYQPTHTMVASANDPQIGQTIRVYGDGKFRNTVDDSESNSTDTAELSIIPQGSQTTKWLDLDISTWDNSGNYHKHWTENGDNLDHATQTLHTVGDLVPGKSYTLTIDGEPPSEDPLSGNITSSDCVDSVCTADDGGYFTFTFTGGYSDHSFDITDDIAPGITITSPESGDTVSADDTISFTDSEETNPQCSLDNSHWVDCQSTVTSFNDLTGWDDIAEKDIFMLHMKDTDAANNTGTAQVDNLTKADIHAPVRSEGSPRGELSSGTAQAAISLKTDETATCKFSDISGTAYADMTRNLDTTDSLTHTKAVSSLSSGNSYSYYVRCRDTSGNINDTDYLISFSVAAAGENESTDNDRNLNVHDVKAKPAQNSITITWKTDHNSKSTIRYGTDKYLNTNKKYNQKEKKHKMILTGLLPNTKYYFRIKATDSDGNQDSSRIHSVVTKAVPTPVSNSSQNENTNQTSPENTPMPTYSGNATPNTCSYIVQAGDSLWSIGQKIYGDATAYPQIVEKNKGEYPNIESKLSIGQGLSFCDKNSPQSTGSGPDNLDQQTEEQSSMPQAQDPQTTSTSFKWWDPFSWFQ